MSRHVRIRITAPEGNHAYLKPRPAVGDILEGELEDEVDWLVGCPTVRMPNGYHMAVGWECEVIEDSQSDTGSKHE